MVFEVVQRRRVEAFVSVSTWVISFFLYSVSCWLHNRIISVFGLGWFGVGKVIAAVNDSPKRKYILDQAPSHLIYLINQPESELNEPAQLAHPARIHCMSCARAEPMWTRQPRSLRTFSHLASWSQDSSWRMYHTLNEVSNSINEGKSRFFLNMFLRPNCTNLFLVPSQVSNVPRQSASAIQDADEWHAEKGSGTWKCDKKGGAAEAWHRSGWALSWPAAF